MRSREEGEGAKGQWGEGRRNRQGGGGGALWEELAGEGKVAGKVAGKGGEGKFVVLPPHSF